MMSRFATVSSGELDAIIDNKDAKNTKKQTRLMFNLLLTYINQKNIEIDLCTATKAEIDSLLSHFYVEVRKADGDLYKKSSFKAMRAAIGRQLQK